VRLRMSLVVPRCRLMWFEQEWRVGENRSRVLLPIFSDSGQKGWGRDKIHGTSVWRRICKS